MKASTLLLLGAVGAVLYFLWAKKKGSGGSLQLAPQASVGTARSPTATSSAGAARTAAGNSWQSVGQEALGKLSQAGQSAASGAAQAGVGQLSDLLKGLFGGSSSNNPTAQPAATTPAEGSSPTPSEQLASVTESGAGMGLYNGPEVAAAELGISGDTSGSDEPGATAPSDSDSGGGGGEDDGGGDDGGGGGGD